MTLLRHLVTEVQERYGPERGRVVGHGRRCRLEGCGGWCIPVRWPDGKLTWPCSKGMASVNAALWKLL